VQHGADRRHLGGWVLEPLLELRLGDRFRVVCIV
jgi:hypothetical protein